MKGIRYSLWRWYACYCWWYVCYCWLIRCAADTSRSRGEEQCHMKCWRLQIPVLQRVSCHRCANVKLFCNNNKNFPSCCVLTPSMKDMSPFTMEFLTVHMWINMKRWNSSHKMLTLTENCWYCYKTCPQWNNCETKICKRESHPWHVTWLSSLHINHRPPSQWI
jgi:hypothetical protein